MTAVIVPILFNEPVLPLDHSRQGRFAFLPLGSAVKMVLKPQPAGQDRNQAMTNAQWDELFGEITASLDLLMESVAQANGDSPREQRLFKQLSAMQAEIESLNQLVEPDKPVVRILPTSAITADQV